MEDSFTTQNSLSKDRYCSEVCKAKCCYSNVSPCANLTKDFKCGIYHLWKDNWCNYQTEEIKTAPIMYAIKHGLINKEILDKCCYAHPEVLKGLNG